MNQQCDKCNNKATHHSVEIKNGEKQEKHLCDLHADEEGMSIYDINSPINSLLNQFVKFHNQKLAARSSKASKEPTCPNCNASFSEFRKKSLFGCPQCYTAFEHKLDALLERVHEGKTHHVGKVPRHVGEGEQTQIKITRMQKRLEDAVSKERYEIAAQLRDEIKSLEDLV